LFRLEAYRAGAGAPRIYELDGYGDETYRTPSLDTTLFNWHLNTPGSPAGEQDPGRTISISSSSVKAAYPLVDSFGACDGSVIPGRTLFEDGGVADNGNGVMGDGGETVDWIAWETDAPVSIAGYHVTGSSDSETSRNRGTELVRFTVDGVVLDIWDNDAASGGQPWRIVSPEPFRGQSFKLEFTRSTTSGPRIYEIDAVYVPPPAGTVLTLR
jgi:hypothetical protein